MEPHGPSGVSRLLEAPRRRPRPTAPRSLRRGVFQPRPARSSALPRGQPSLQRAYSATSSNVSAWATIAQRSVPKSEIVGHCSRGAREGRSRGRRPRSPARLSAWAKHGFARVARPHPRGAGLPPRRSSRSRPSIMVRLIAKACHSTPPHTGARIGSCAFAPAASRPPTGAITPGAGRLFPHPWERGRA